MNLASRSRSCGVRPSSAAVRGWAIGTLALIVSAGGTSGWAQSDSFLGVVAPLPGAVAEVLSPATGEIHSAREAPFTVGDRVKQGEPLAVIANQYNLHDAAHISNTRWNYLKSMMEGRYAALEARIAREKAERLRTHGTVSGQRLAELRMAEQVAEAEYLRRKTLLEQQDEQILGDTLERRGLVAPISGQISFASFTQGQMVHEGFLLYRIVDLSQVAVSVRVPESAVRPWPAGTAARIRFDDFPGREFSGQLLSIAPVVDPATRTRDVLFRVNNAGELLRFGMVGRVEVQAP